MPAGLHSLVEAAAAANPTAVALVDGETEITYGELDRRSAALAAQLGPRGAESLVGVCMQRSADLIVALLGILRSGAAYVPLDPAYPRERIDFILADAALDVVVTDAASADLIGTAEAVLATDLPHVSAPPVDAHPDRLAYLIYTSGSTGRPKAVAITHRNVTTMLTWAARWWDAEDRSGVLASTSVCFDLSVFEIFLPLAYGGTVILAPDALALPDLPARDRVRLLNTVPSAMNQLVRAGLLPEGVRTVNLAGEPLPRRLADQVYALPHVQRLWNLYGPSEDTTYSTFGLVERASEAEPSIGGPIDGTGAWVLSADLEPVEDGEVGELYLSGSGVARGYLQRPGLTADRFLPDPFSGDHGSRMYRTGDLVRRHRGELMFLGRSDHQVKIRGHRVELGEIDAVLVRHPAVAAAVSVSDLDAADEVRLVSYVQPADGAALDTGQLRRWLSERLPAYAVPAVLMPLPVLPRTPNGKVDRAALPDPQVERDQSGAGYVAPVTALEQELAAIWADLLGVDQVGLADRFDDLGGHSLLALRMLGRIEAQLATSVSLAAFLAAPTLGALAGLVEAHRGVLSSTPLRGGVGTSPGPLSPVQEDFWFTEQLRPDSAMYTVPLRFRVRGRIEAARLAGALSAVVARHEALRTAHTETGTGVVATVLSPYNVAVPVVDLRGMPAAERDQAAERHRAEAASTAIEVSSGRLLAATLIQLSDAEAELILGVHHIGFDGYSTGVLTAELNSVLLGLPDADAPAIQGRDYAAWRADVTPAQRQDSVEFWQTELGGADLLLELPADHPRPPVLTFRGRRNTRPLDPELLAEIQQLGRRHGASLFTVLLTGLDVLVHQLTGRTDFVIGAQTADRMAPKLRDHIGLCINTLPVRTSWTGDPTFSELLTDTRDRFYGALPHQALSYVDIIRALNLPRSLQHTNLVQVMIAVQNYAVPPVRTPELTIEHLPELDNGTAKVDLTLFFEFAADGPVLAAEWSTDLFSAETIERWLDHYLAILADAVDRPGRSVTELGTSAGLRRLRAASTGEVVDWDDRPPLHALVARTAAEHPARIAVTGGSTQLSYAGLLADAHRLAHRLRELGVGPEQLVGICVDRHPRMLVGLLGILAAGAAYLPLDPDFPAERIGYMLRDSGATLLLTEEHLLERLPPGRPDVVLLAEDVSAYPDAAPGVPVSLAQPAYVLYTSGSTGRPKGVQISHGSMVNFLLAMQRSPGLSPEDRVAALTTLSFDIAGLELWLPLIVGARVVVMDRTTASDGALLAHRLEADEVTVMQATPMTWRLLLAAGWSGRSTLRAWCGGEALPADLADELVKRVGELWNLYGPTEATIWTSVHGIDGTLGQGVVPIGRPIPNTSAWLLDEQLRPVPWGAIGELCLGGAGVARGYLRRPGLTADRFVPDPFGPPGSRLYCTGDRARWRTDGTLEFLGRDDDQIKLRGFRIELGEVESVLRSLPGVDAAAAAIWGADPAEQRLVAYVVPDPSVVTAALALDELRTQAQRFLPEHMVPSQLELLDALPLTANRKLDRKALPEPGRPVADAGTPPGDPFEEIVAEVWCEVLGLEQVTVESNFFALGGHSLLATRVVGRLGQRFGLTFPVRLVFEEPTVQGQARRIEADLLASLGAEESATGGES